MEMHSDQGNSDIYWQHEPSLCSVLLRCYTNSGYLCCEYLRELQQGLNDLTGCHKGRTKPKGGIQLCYIVTVVGKDHVEL